jgi:hypothetical protein
MSGAAAGRVNDSSTRQRFATPLRTSFANRWLAMIWVGCLVGTGGCAAYRFGPQSLYRSDIRTVHVPVIRNDTFRHDLGVRLTEAVIKEIELRTPYDVTSDPAADSVLRCRVVNETKRVLTETATDDPRAVEAVVGVRADWVSRNGEMLMQNAVASADDLAISFGQDVRFVPEAGQSIDTATQEAIDDLAQRIVSQMELRW